MGPDKFGEMNGRASDSVLKVMVDNGLKGGAKVVEIPFGENLARCDCVSLFLRNSGYLVGDIKSVPFFKRGDMKYNYFLPVRRRE